MKNIKRLLVATIALISVSSTANLVQPSAPVGEDYPVRINGGILSGMAGSRDGFGVRNVGVGLGFAHNVGYDFEYGMSLAGNWASYDGRIFTEAAKNTQGARLDVELMTRYMPEVANKVHAGLSISLGWGQQFGQNAKALNDQMSFGDINFKVGPAFSVGLGDVLSLSLETKFSMHNIRFGAKAGTAAEKSANQMGLDLPVGAWLALSDSAGLFIEANTRFANFKDFGRSLREEVYLGVGFAI